MAHEIEEQDEAIEVIVEYLERLGVPDLRQPHDPNTINKSAVLRYLIAERLDEALANPPAAAGEKPRIGQGKTKKCKPVSFDTTTPKSRQ